MVGERATEKMNRPSGIRIDMPSTAVPGTVANDPKAARQPMPVNQTTAIIASLARAAARTGIAAIRIATPSANSAVSEMAPMMSIMSSSPSLPNPE